MRASFLAGQMKSFFLWVSFETPHKPLGNGLVGSLEGFRTLAFASLPPKNKKCNAVTSGGQGMGGGVRGGAFWFIPGPGLPDLSPGV